MKSNLRWDKKLFYSREGEIEKMLPLVMRHMAQDLIMGMHFVDVIRDIAKAGYGPISEEFQKVSKDVKLGKSIQDALIGMQRRIESRYVKRAILQMVTAYETEDAKPLLEIAKDMTDMQRTEIKEYSAKFSFYLVVMIATSAILPAFLAGFFSIGTIIVEMEFNPMNIYVLFGIILPMINFLMLYNMLKKAPRHYM